MDMDNYKDYIARLREDFARGTLSESDLKLSPDLQFEFWMKQAVEAKVPEVQAMTLCTVSEKNQPSSRIVYLREFENNMFSFYGNYTSRKARDMFARPAASVSFFWPELERQIRIEGTVQKASAAQSDAYFNSRPYESKLGAWASMQSSVIASRDELEQKIEIFKKQYTPETITRPEYWGGFVLQANYYEFWQGRPSRLHDRMCYELKDNQWTISRLSP